MQTVRWDADIRPVSSLGQLESDWLRIEKKANCSFFQSWHWVGSWMRVLPESIKPLCLRLTANGLPVAIAILVQSTEARHGLIRSRQLYVGETGDRKLDAITVEYGGPLVDARYMRDVPTEIVRSLISERIAWDELFLPGLGAEDTDAWLHSADISNLGVRLLDEKPCFTVDLKQFESFDGYLAQLSANTRQQIRRAIRGYEARGAIRITEASSKGEYDLYHSDMKQLHQEYWEGKGHSGGFGSDFQVRFHRELIKSTRDSGSLQFLKFTCDGTVIGYLYNFDWQDVVYCYQSGFKYSNSDARLKPGLVCHSLAIEFNREKGKSIYNFLAGGSRYKRSLSMKEHRLTWPVLQKRRLRFKVENLLSNIRRRL